MIRDAIDREVEAVDSGESYIFFYHYYFFRFSASLLTPATSRLLLFLRLLRVPAGQAVGLPQEGDAVWQFGQAGTPHGQVLLG